VHASELHLQHDEVADRVMPVVLCSLLLAAHGKVIPFAAPENDGG
jgi:hypothetical protein